MEITFTARSRDELKEIYKYIESILKEDITTKECEPVPHLIKHLMIKYATAKRLRMNDITTVEQLLKMSEVDLIKLPTFGRNSLYEVRQALAEHGLSVGCALNSGKC